MSFAELAQQTLAIQGQDTDQALGRYSAWRVARVAAIIDIGGLRGAAEWPSRTAARVSICRKPLEVRISAEISGARDRERRFPRRSAGILMQFDRRSQLYALLPASPRKVSRRQPWQRLRGLDAEFNVNLKTVEPDLTYRDDSRFLSVASDGARPTSWSRDTSLLASDPI